MCIRCYVYFKHKSLMINVCFSVGRRPTFSFWFGVFTSRSVIVAPVMRDRYCRADTVVLSLKCRVCRKRRSLILNRRLTKFAIRLMMP